LGIFTIRPNGASFGKASRAATHSRVRSSCTRTSLSLQLWHASRFPSSPSAARANLTSLRCICIYMHIYTYEYTYMYIFIYKYVYINKVVARQLDISPMYMCMYIYTYIYIRILYICKYIFTNTSIYICAPGAPT